MNTQSTFGQMRAYEDPDPRSLCKIVSMYENYQRNKKTQKYQETFY